MIKLPEPVGVRIKKRNGSLWHFAHFDPKTEERPESDDDFEVEFVFTEAQLKQAIKDALENAAKACDDKHDAWRFGEGEDSDSGPKECAAEIRKLKDQL